MNAFHAIDFTHPTTRWLTLLIVQVTVVAGGGLFAAKFCRRDAASRHAVLLVALLVLLVCPIATFLFGHAGWTFLNVPVVASVDSVESPPDILELPARFRETNDALVAGPTRPIVVDSTVRPSANTWNSTVAPPAKSASPGADVKLQNEIAIQSSGEIAATPTKSFDVVGALPYILLAIWAVGVGVCIARMIHGWRVVHCLRCAAVPIGGFECSTAAERVEAMLRLRSPLRILVSDEIGTAVVAGLFRPVVLVPRSYVENLSAAELFVVLTHEAADIARRDLVVGLLQRTAVAFYWPHPFVHLLSRQLSRAREEVCDNYVLLENESPRYAEVLLRIVQSSRVWATPSGSLAFFSRRWKLEERVAGLLDSHRSKSTRPGSRLLAGATTVLAGAGLIFAGLQFIDGSAKEVVAADTAATIESKNESEPVPAGARLRLGDGRFRHDGWHKNVGFAGNGDVLISSSERSLRFWDSKTGRMLREVTFENFNANQMRMSHDRKQVVALGFSRNDETNVITHGMRFYDVETGAETTKVEWNGPSADVRHFALTPDDDIALIANTMGYVTVIDIPTGTRLLDYKFSDHEIEGLAMSPDGALVAVATLSKELFLWEWQTGAAPALLSSGQSWRTLAFSPDGKQLAAAVDSGNQIQLYSVETKFVERSFADLSAEYISVGEMAFTPDGTKLVAANDDRRVNGKTPNVLVWDVATGELQKRFAAPGMSPRELSISPDGKRVAAIDWATNVRVWDMETGDSVGTGADGHQDLVRAVAFTNSSKQVVTVSDDRTMRVWDSSTGRQIAKFQHERDVYAMTISADGNWASTATIGDTITLWDFANWEEKHNIQGKRRFGSSKALAISPDDNQLLAIQDNLMLFAWDTATAKQLRAIPIRPSGLDLSGDGFGLLPGTTEPGEVSSRVVMHHLTDYKFTPDASKLILVGRQYYWIFDAQTGKELARREPAFSPYSAAISSDGRRVAIGGRSKSVTLPNGKQTVEDTTQLAVFALDSGEQVWQQPAAAQFCGPLSFARDGNLLTAVLRGAKRPTIALYDAADGKQFRSIEGSDPSGAPNTIAFSPNGKSLACAQADATILVWDLNSPNDKANK